MKLSFPRLVAALALPILGAQNGLVHGQFNLKAEDGPHEAVWLQWPHDYGWDSRHVARYEETWIQMTEALHKGELVNIIAYNGREKRRIKNLLASRGIDMSRVNLYRYPTDDVWIRDNGPMFVFNENGDLVVEDWKFNGWGRKADWWYDDYIPNDVAYELSLDVEFVGMVNEGGSVEVDGRGTLMAKRSSILNRNRNPGLTQADAETYFRRYFGVENFIWLDGTPGLDLTDDHIDGTARFANGDTIVTHEPGDMHDPSEYDLLVKARDANGNPYKIVTLPLTRNAVPGTGGFKGLYVNYYVGNDVVIVPAYNDPNDTVARDILQGLYPQKKMVLIDFSEVYVDGGVVHCVTKEQPVAN